jgi:hypothetical protein
MADALDHVVRVARKASQPTVRLSWIIARCETALDGKPWDSARRDPRGRKPRTARAISALEGLLDVVEVAHGIEGFDNGIDQRIKAARDVVQQWRDTSAKFHGGES